MEGLQQEINELLRAGRGTFNRNQELALEGAGIHAHLPSGEVPKPKPRANLMALEGENENARARAKAQRKKNSVKSIILQQIRYGEGKSEIVRNYRVYRKIYKKGPIAYVQLKDGTHSPFFVGETENHAEQSIQGWIKHHHVNIDEIEFVYVELSPCTRGMNCYAMLNDLLGEVNVYYSFDLKTETDKFRSTIDELKRSH